MFPNEKTQKNPKKYICKICDFYTYNKKDFNRHNITAKHLLLTNPNLKTPKNPLYTCNCGNMYKHSSSLCAHKKKCNTQHVTYSNIDNDQTEVKILTNMVSEVLKQNQELIHQNNETIKYNQEFTNKIIELSKNCITNNSNNITNCHNKTFNLQFFLNETCKDAMNIMDFVDSIKLQLSDLENIGSIGYVEGISNIIVNNLKALDVNQRPIHCADKKREVMYVKDENKWEKEDENKKKIRKAINRVACKNQNLIPCFKEAHPDCLKSASKFSDQYNKIIVESMGGSGDNDKEKEDKIIRNISKNVIIEK
jgi:hypothetical protein